MWWDWEDVNVRMRIRLRPLNVDAALWVSWLCVYQTKHTVSQVWPESDTCLKVKFNLIKISAQTKTLRGSVYSCCYLLQETRVEMIYRTHAERGKHKWSSRQERSRRRAGEEVAAQMDTQRWIATAGSGRVCRVSSVCSKKKKARIAFLCSVFYTFFFLCQEA